MSDEDDSLQTLFDMSTEDLRSLLTILKPGLEEKQLNTNDIAILRSKVTEWLLMNGLSTLHRFAKENGKWLIPLAKSACDSCRKFQKEHKYTPSIVHPVINRETFVTLDIKSDTPENDDKEDNVSSPCYQSVTECLTAFGNCLSCPVINLFSSCRNCCGSQ